MTNTGTYNIVERHNGHTGISGAWLAEAIGQSRYNNALSRGHIRSLRRGGNGRTALIDWQSMGSKLKAMVIASLGCDPALMSRQSLLREVLQLREQRLLDTESYEYFDQVRVKDGGRLKPEKLTELWNNARILDAIRDYMEEKRLAAEMGRLKLNIKREFADLAYEVSENLVEYPNTLPTSGERLRKKYNEYLLHGCEVLVHGLTGKDSNHRRRDAKERAVVAALSASGAKLNDMQVSKVAATMGIEIDRRRVQEIRKADETAMMQSRDGKGTYRNRQLMQVDRQRPDMPLKMWSLDGWTAELFYQERRLDKAGHVQSGYWNRLVVEVVTDVMSDYPIGYAIGERENAALITEALQNAVSHTRELLGGYYAPWQIQSDHFAIKEMSPRYAALAKYVTPASVGNAKAKPVERYFAYLESEYLFAFANNAGHNITAKSQPNDDHTNRMKYYFPDKEQCMAQIHKIMEVERSRKYKAMREAWQTGDAAKRRQLDMVRYLMAFGETGRGNMLTPNGLKVIRGGVEYKFDCMDTEMRRHMAERWVLRYDPRDMNQALAVSEDGRLRYMMQAKTKVPMALVDYTEQDWRALAEYRDFNARITEEHNSRMEQLCADAGEYVRRNELEDVLSARLLTDSRGQHKTPKRMAQQKAAQTVDDAVLIEEQPAANRDPRAIFENL